MASSTDGAVADGAPYASVLESLHQWRQHPDDVQIDKRAQQTTLEWLLSQEDKHWFCSREGAQKSNPEYKKVLFDVATFTVRLIGFKSANKVLDWRNHVEDSLQTCHYCVKGWVKAQKDVGPRYLKSKWPEATVANWYLSLHAREVERVKAALSNSDLAPEPRNLILYNILCDPAFYSNADIATLLEGQLPDANTFEQSLPRDIDTPPGIVAYLVNPDTSIRDWSSQFMSLRPQLTLKEFEDKDSGSAPAVFGLVEYVAKRDRQKSNAVKEDLKGESMYTTNDRDFWHGLARVLEWLSDDIFKTHLAGGGRTLDIMRVVSGHLGDKGNHWIEVVRCFRTILERLDTKAWNNLLDTAIKNEVSQTEDDVVDAGYAGARLHDALDNSQFLAELKLAQDASTSAQSSIEEALFGWIYYFLRSLRASRFFHPCFSIVCNRLLDEYGAKALYDDDTRMRTLKATFKVFCLVFNEEPSDLENRTAWLYRRSTLPDLERRATIIAETAFKATSGSTSLANKAARASQSLVHKLAVMDSQALLVSTYKLAALRASLKAGQKVPAIIEHAPRLCLDIYSRSEMQLSMKFNPSGAAGFVKALAVSAHLPRLSSRAWAIKDAALFDKYIKSDMKLINEQKEGFAKPISGILRSLANEDSTTIQAFLKLEGVAEAVMILVLCPTESIAMQAQSVLRQGYDVSSRIECIRALIEKQPEASLKGVIAALRSFKENANLLPEACAQAKRLVRCLTDVITVLCDPTDVMIRDEQWVERNNARSPISKLWNLMCNDIALIFEKTEHWAPAFENEEMTTWMRDALIFLKEMLDEVRTFEAAATGTSFTSDNPTPRKMSNRGRQMVEALNEPLAKMTAWLRLNDRDLLEQTTSVTVQLLDRFAKTRIPVSEEVVKRIRKLADKMKDPKTRKDQLLKPEQIQAMIGALARHPDYADDLLHLVNPAKRDTQKQEWGKLLDGKSGGSKASASLSGRSTPIELGSDSDDDALHVVSSAAKTSRLLPSSSSVKKASTAQKQSMAPHPAFKAGTSSSRPSLPLLKGQQPKPAARYKTAPTRMKNAIYSHAAMRAAQGQTSSEEDSDEEGHPRAGLAGFEPNKAGPSRVTKPIHLPQTAEQRKAKMLDLSMNAIQDVQHLGQGTRRRGQRIMTAADLAVQSQNKARMRYNPDYSDLHRRILQWNLLQNGTTPDPSFRWPQKIPSSFEDVDEYINTFLPLLLLECWSEIVTAKEEMQNGESEIEPFTGRLAGRVSVDDFTEVFISVDRLPERNAISENDVVMLSGPAQTIGKIHQVIRKPQKIDIVVRCHLGKDDGSISRSLMNGTNWTIRKLFSLSTVHREYGGLMSMPYYDLVDEILQPSRHGKPDIDPVLVDRAMKAYRVNRPQASAIIGSMTTLGFTLIQGPPGTGKTKTILGLVGAVISNRRNLSTGSNIGPSAGDKMLVCAPSNAAVDEIVKRLKDGVYDSEGRKFVPKVVRIGAESAVHISVNDIFIDTLVEKVLGGTSGKTAAGEAQTNMATVRTQLQTLRQERDDKRNEKSNIANNDALLSKLNSEISSITQRINDLGDQLDRERDRLTQSNRAMETSKRKARADILASADVICTTLSGAGHEYLANFDFETVIIDEAAQSVEISSLIPLKYNCQRCIMVGDPNQLPPTVKSREATNAGYNKSLFVRLHTAAPDATHLLSIQYRMHPDISSFPSKAFYEARLADGPNMEVSTRQSWHDTSELFPPYAFLHVRGSREERGRHHSLFNRQEASVAVALYARLVQECKDVDLSQRVGIVTAYKAQVGELRKQFRNRFGQDILDKVDINTVDGYQGQEKDIIILSCVRGGTPDGSSIGFLSDVRRMNVALTRAKSSLFVLGDAKALQSNENWRKLVEDAKERGFLREVDPSSFTLRAVVHPKTISPGKKAPAKGKKRESDASRFAILPAPDGLMKPSELAKSTSGLGASEGAKSSIGIKKRLMDDMKVEENRANGVKRVKKEEGDGEDAVPSNAGVAFSKPVVKKEDSPEEGELMDGIEYTDPVPSKTIHEASNGQVKVSRQSENMSIDPPKPAPAVSRPQPPKVGGPPILVAPSKPSSSMFIPRKKPTGPTKPGGPARKF